MSTVEKPVKVGERFSILSIVKNIIYGVKIILYGLAFMIVLLTCFLKLDFVLLLLSVAYIFSLRLVYIVKDYLFEYFI